MKMESRCSSSRSRSGQRMGAIVRCLLFAASVALASGELCADPAVVSSSYSTSDGVLATDTVFIVEVSLYCGSEAQNVALYADVDGKQFPVTKGQDVGRYQVSWSEPHRTARSGTHAVRFYDEEAYSALRKAQRNKEDVSDISPLFVVAVEHRGVWGGPLVATEVVAALVGVGLYAFAYRAKGLIQS
ncbi:translocon-associated protein subunit delta [Lampetra planeri]